jgi:O-antigen ligase
MLVVPIIESLATPFHHVPLFRGAVAGLFAVLFAGAALSGSRNTSDGRTILRYLLVTLGLYAAVSQASVLALADFEITRLIALLLSLPVLLWVGNARISEPDFRSAMTWYVVGSAIAATISFSLSIELLRAGGQRAWADVSMDVSSNRNTLAPLYITALAAAMFIKLNLRKYIRISAALVIFLAITTLFSRSGYLALLILLVTGTSGNRRTLIATIPLVVIAGIVLILPDSPVADRITYTFGAAGSGVLDDSANFRFILWQLALDQFAENPILGGGLGNSMLPISDPLWGEIIYAHNYYLTQLAQLGLIGFFLTITMFVSFIRAAFRQDAMMRKFSLCAISVFAVLSITGEPLYSSAAYVFYFIALRLCLPDSDRCPQAQSPKQPAA